MVLRWLVRKDKLTVKKQSPRKLRHKGPELSLLVNTTPIAPQRRCNFRHLPINLLPLITSANGKECNGRSLEIYLSLSAVKEGCHYIIYGGPFLKARRGSGISQVTEPAVRWACPLRVHRNRVSGVFDTLGAVKYSGGPP